MYFRIVVTEELYGT